MKRLLRRPLTDRGRPPRGGADQQCRPHTASGLRVPQNNSLCRPTRARAERHWEGLTVPPRPLLSWWLFADTRAIMDACRTAWDNSIAATGRIQSLTNVPWVG